MQATFYSIWLALYIISFALLIASPGRRSFSIVACLLAAALGLLWLDIARVPLEDRNWSYSVSEVAFRTMVVGAAAGLVARGVTLAKSWRRFGKFGLATTILALVAAPIFVGGATGYDRWQRRPPTAKCVDRSSFSVQLAAERLSVPNWPLVMVSSGDEHFSQSNSTGQRRLCERAGNGPPTTVGSATFFFDHVTFKPLQGGMRAWADRKCEDAPDDVAASLVCGECPLEQLSIYADEDFARRTVAYGRISSHASFAQQQVDGHYAQPELSDDRRRSNIRMELGCSTMERWSDATRRQMGIRHA